MAHTTGRFGAVPEEAMMAHCSETSDDPKRLLVHAVFIGLTVLSVYCGWFPLAAAE